MTTIRFSDGETIQTDGRLRASCRADGWYVVGERMLIPVRDEAEARELIAALQANSSSESSAGDSSVGSE